MTCRSSFASSDKSWGFNKKPSVGGWVDSKLSKCAIYLSAAAVDVQTDFRDDVREGLEPVEKHRHELDEEDADEADDEETSDRFQAQVLFRRVLLKPKSCNNSA